MTSSVSNCTGSFTGAQ